jgi:hypothetical protein
MASFLQISPPNCHMQLPFSNRYTRTAHNILLDIFINRIIFGQRYKSLNSSFFKFLQPLLVFPFRPGYLPRQPSIERHLSVSPTVYCIYSVRKNTLKMLSAFNFKSLFLITQYYSNVSTVTLPTYVLNLVRNIIIC